MSVRKIFNASAGYTASIASTTVTGPSDTSFDSTTLLLTGDVEVDPSFANVSLLLDGNTLTDKSNNKAAVTAYGNAAVSATKKKFGTSSLYFDGTGDYISVTAGSQFNFGTGDFTEEAWIYPTTLKDGTLWDHRIGSALTTALSPAIRTTGKIELYYNGSFILSSTNAVPIDTWSHIAMVRSGGVITFFINGVNNGTVNNTSNLSGNSCFVGAPNDVADTTSTWKFQGYIDDFRITKGVARYTTNFTPPVKALPTHEILDSSVYRLPVTTTGNARIDTTTKKYGTGSMYFDGTGSYTLIPHSTLHNLASSDFTIECWLYPTSSTISKAVFTKRVFQGSASYQGYFSDTNGYISFFNGSTEYISTTTINMNQWTHCAWVYYNNTIRIFVNGINVLTTSAITITNNGEPLIVGANRYSTAYDYIGYIDDFRITKGSARYTANFTPPSASLPSIPPTIPADPWWGNVSLLLDGNTTDAYDPYWQNVSLMLTGDDFIDWSNQHNTITNNGSVTLNSSIKKYNSSSYNFDGPQKLISSNTEALLTSNFTMELWAYRTGAGTGDRSLLDSGGGNNFLFRWNASGVLQFYIASSSAVELVMSYTYAFPLTTWIYFAVVRNGTAFTMYVNGNSVATGTSSTSLTNNYAGGPYTIGICGRSNSSSDFFQGNIADIRITKGIARYTANFTPPTTALPSFKIQDRTQNNLTVTPYGNVQLSTDVMKNGTGSIFFDGTGDYLTLPMSSNLQLGSGQFTVECWFYATNVTSSTALFGCYRVTSYPSNTAGWDIVFASGNVAFRWGSPAYNDNGSTAVTANQWHHIAVVNTGSNIRMYVDGVQATSTTTNATVTDSAEPTLWIGWAGSLSGTTINPFNGYIDDLRITKGYARYTQNFTPPSQSFATQYISTGYDANYADVSLLLNGNGTNGSQVFTDLSGTPKTITAYGNAKLNTSIKKYGTGSLYLPDATSYIKCAESTTGIFNADDFTVELWAYFISNSTGSNYQCIFCTRDGTTAAANTVFFGITNTGYIVFYTSSAILTSSSTIPASSWIHLALVRKSGTLAIYMNGVSQGSVSFTTALTGTIPTIGNEYNLATGAMNAYFDDLRITKGIARYTTNFTPPTYQLPTDTTGTVIDPLRSSTSLLLRGNGTNGSTSFTDESPNNYAITVDGTAVINTTYKKYGTGSIRINGVGNGLRTTSSIGNFGTDDLTIECWAMFDAITNNGLFHLATTNSISPGVSGLAVGYYSNAWGIYYNGTYSATTISTAPLANTWFHLALVRYKGLVSLFFNGIQQGTSFTDSTTNFTDTFANIGWWYGLSTGGGQMSGYIDDFRITKGYARYTANFTPPTYEDPIVTGTVYDYNYPQVSLLLNGDGTNGSTVFKDLSSSPKTITAYGNAQISTAQKKFGTGSMYFDGSGDYLSIPLVGNVGTSDLTVDAWVNLGTSPGGWGHPLIDTRATNGASTGFAVQIESNGVFGIYTGGGYAGSTATGIFTFNTWHHIAVVRNNSTWKCFIDGVQILTFTNSNNFTDTTCLIGTNVPQNGALQGYIDDLRITKGLARYTANFTPPTAPLPTSHS